MRAGPQSAAEVGAISGAIRRSVWDQRANGAALGIEDPEVLRQIVRHRGGILARRKVVAEDPQLYRGRRRAGQRGERRGARVDRVADAEEREEEK